MKNPSRKITIRFNLICFLFVNVKLLLTVTRRTATTTVTKRTANTTTVVPQLRTVTVYIYYLLFTVFILHSSS